MHFSTSIAIVAALASAVTAYPNPPNDRGNCPPFSGDFSIKQYQVYPENADFDFTNCKLYVG